MSWIAEYDTQGREFPTCVHVTKTAGTMTHGVTYVPIEDGKAVRAENAKLRELATLNWEWAHCCCGNNCKMQTEECGYGIDRECNYEREIYDRMHELGIEVD